MRLSELERPNAMLADEHLRLASVWLEWERTWAMQGSEGFKVFVAEDATLLLFRKLACLRQLLTNTA